MFPAVLLFVDGYAEGFPKFYRKSNVSTLQRTQPQ
jgi:hypothetical protein